VGNESQGGDNGGGGDEFEGDEFDIRLGLSSNSKANPQERYGFDFVNEFLFGTCAHQLWLGMGID